MRVRHSSLSYYRSIPCSSGFSLAPVFNIYRYHTGQTPTVVRGVMGVGPMRDVTHPCHPWPV
eukprot:6835059-Prymnesium_polylepis.1